MDKQLIELQLKLTESNRSLGQVLQLINLNKVEQKRGAATIEELNAVADDTPSYKSVGRMFKKEPLPSLKKQLQGMMVQVDNQITALETKPDYLKKQVKQDEDNLNEMVQQFYRKGVK